MGRVGRPGGVFGRPEALLGRLGGILGRSWAVLEASWGRLGTSWERLGSKKVANMVPIWLPKRSPNRKKIEVKNDQNFDAPWGRFFFNFVGFGDVK